MSFVSEHLLSVAATKPLAEPAAGTRTRHAPERPGYAAFTSRQLAAQCHAKMCCEEFRISNASVTDGFFSLAFTGLMMSAFITKSKSFHFFFTTMDPKTNTQHAAWTWVAFSTCSSCSMHWHGDSLMTTRRQGVLGCETGMGCRWEALWSSGNSASIDTGAPCCVFVLCVCTLTLLHVVPQTVYSAHHVPVFMKDARASGFTL